jgi:uncharacterized protein with HEPN domain
MWRDPAWLLDMLQAGRKVLNYSRELSEPDFSASGLHQDAILRQLAIMGEAAKQISADYRAGHPEVPWRKIAGMRDVVVHSYFKVDLREVWRIVSEDVPVFVVVLERLVPPPESEG